MEQDDMSLSDKIYKIIWYSSLVVAALCIFFSISMQRKINMLLQQEQGPTYQIEKKIITKEL